MASAFEKDTSVEQLDSGVYAGRIDPRWSVVRGPHGGYLAGLILRALMKAVEPEFAPRSYTTHFVAAPEPGEVTIRTVVERKGRSLVSLSARAEQEGRLFAISLGAFSRPWHGMEFEDAPMPSFPPPEEHERADTSGGPPFLSNFEYRGSLGAPFFSGSEHAVVGSWMRMAEPCVADEVVVAALMDAGPPAVFPRATMPLIAPTIDLTVHFRRTLPLEDAAAEDFYLGRFRSTMARDGFFEEDGELWSRDGRLIAQSRQLALALTPRD